MRGPKWTSNDRAILAESLRRTGILLCVVLCTSFVDCQRTHAGKALRYVWPSEGITMTRRTSRRQVLDVLRRGERIVEVRLGSKRLLDTDSFATASGMKEIGPIEVSQPFTTDAQDSVSALGCGSRWRVITVLHRAWKVVSSHSLSGRCSKLTLTDKNGRVIYSQYELRSARIPFIYIISCAGMAERAHMVARAPVAYRALTLTPRATEFGLNTTGYPGGQNHDYPSQPGTRACETQNGDYGKRGVLGHGDLCWLRHQSIRQELYSAGMSPRQNIAELRA